MAITLVHGLGVSHRYFARLLRLIPASAPDLEGDTVEGLAASLGDAIARPSLLVANSLGCQVAAELAVRRPELVTGLVLIGPTWDPGAPTLPRQAWQLVNGAYREPPSLLPVLAVEYARWGPARMLRTARSMLRHPMADRLAAQSAPTIVLRGERDPMCGPAWARLAAANARGRLVQVPAAAHALHWSHPELVQETVEELVERARRLEHGNVPRFGDDGDTGAADRVDP